MFAWASMTTLAPADIVQAFKDLAVPALRLVRSSEPSTSHLGGVPLLPESFIWPSCDEVPLNFLACLDLAHLPEKSGVEWLPRLGRLLFFYDTTRQPWGFDPQEKMQWRVILAPSPLATDVPVHPAQLRPLSRQDVYLRATVSYPPLTRAGVQAFELTPQQQKALSEVVSESFASAPMHQVGGYPVPVSEDDMEVECQLASAGINCGQKNYADTEQAKSVLQTPQDWQLLLQLDADPRLRMQWSRDGRLYFWVRQTPARQGMFDDTWAVFQCL